MNDTIKRLRDRALDMGVRALNDVMSSESRAAAVGEAVRRVQEGKRVLDEQGARMVSALGLANTEDVKRVQRKVGQLRKRMRSALDYLERH